MICFPAILIFKFIQRFPIVVLVLYATQVFGNIEVDKELEEQMEKVEYLESTFKADFRSLYSDVAKATNSKIIFSFGELTPSLLTGFILTTSHKLYVLFSRLLLDHQSLLPISNSDKKRNHLLTTKHYNHGKYKENHRSEAFSYSCNLFCLNHCDSFNSSLLNLVKC